MKKKIMCMALAVVMGLSMTTPAFARIGNGNVNGDGILSGDDAAWVLQYVLDHQFNGDGINTFALEEANFNGDYTETGDDLITADDSAWILSHVLGSHSDVFVDIGDAFGDILFSDVINENLENTPIEDIFDSVMNTESQAENNVDRVNRFLDSLTFENEKGDLVNIRTEGGWNKFADAVSSLVQDEEAFDALKENVLSGKFETIDEVLEAYENFKQAIPSSTDEAAFKEAADKIVEITGENYITVTWFNPENDEVIRFYDHEEVLTIVAENDLEDYSNTPINKYLEAFGPNLIVKITNPAKDYETQFTLTTERR